MLDGFFIIIQQDQVASFDFIENNTDPSSSNPYDSLR